MDGHETTKKGSSVRDKPVSDTLQNNGFGLTNDKLPFKCVKHAETTKMDTDVKMRLQDTFQQRNPPGKSNLMKCDSKSNAKLS